MPFDGFVAKKIITELKPKLIGGKINKVQQPNKNDVILSIYNNGENHNLLLCTNPDYCRINLTSFQKTNPQNAYNFCMLLRKYLTGGKIKDITTYDLERTIKITFDCYNELNDLVTRKLFIEIMSRQSNIILTNENNIIIDTLKHFELSNRDLLPAHEYIYSPSTKQSFLNLENFEDFRKYFEIENENYSITKTIFDNFIGFSKPIIKETLRLLNILDNSTNIEDIKRIYSYFKNLYYSLEASTSTFKEINNKKDFVLYLESDDSLEYVNEDDLVSANEFIDNYYYQKEITNTFINSKNVVLKVVLSSLKKVYKKLEHINQKLKECDDMDKFRLYGELLTANLYKFQNLPNTDHVEVENYYDENKTITIPLDITIPISKNIEKYFKKYNKLKNALSIVTEQKKDTEKELDYIESIVFSIENSRTLSEINEIYLEISNNLTTKKEVMKKEKNKQKPKNPKKQDEISFVMQSIDGFQIYIGKNNLQNEYITHKLASPNDIWFHTQKIHGSHVLLKNPDNLEITDDILFKCACLAKENSKANGSVNVSVDYCFARYVKKSPINRPGMVIYTNFKTIIVK